jgi:ribosomal protein S27E
MSGTTTPNVYLEYPGTDASAYFGISVSSAGDVNGDGYSDVIVGAYGSNVKCTDCGAAYLFFGSSSMSGTTTPNVYLQYPGTDAYAYFGNSVSSAGDVNGDGYSDLIVGAYFSDVKCTDCGAAYIFFGSSSMSGTTTPNVYLEYPGTDTSVDFGVSVSSAGDVNGDGYSDLIVGAYDSDVKCSDCGAAYIFWSGANFNASKSRYFQYPGTDAGAYFGYSVSSAGDVNGDGYSDLIVGAYYSDVKCTDCGAAYLFFGSSSMSGTTTPNVYLEYPGTDTAAIFGYSVSSAGDVNGDGYSDLIVGAYYSDVKCTDCGAAYIFFGSSSMSGTTTPNVYLEYPGTDTSAIFGISVSSAGDVNGDGYSDVIVGAYGSNVKCTSCGAAYIFFGSSSMSGTTTPNVYLEYPGTDTYAHFGNSVSSAGDVNGDGYSDLIVGAHYSDVKCSNCGAAYIFFGSSSMSGTTTPNVYLQYPGTDTYARFGNSVSSAGDVNGDGYSDLIVGAYYSDVKCTDCGAAYLFFGSSSMSGTTTPNVYLEYPGTDTSAIFGRSVSSAGDVNGDGYSDVIVGAYLSDVKCTDCGAAYIFFGSSSMSGTTTPNVYLEYPGTDASAYFGISVSSAGDVNGDGYSDVIVGAYYSDVKCTDCGAAYNWMGGKATSTPFFYFAVKLSGSPSQIDVTCDLQSTIGASIKNLKLDVYRFGSTNAWENATTISNCATDTDCTFSVSITNNVPEYYDGSFWTYWRISQESGNQVLKIDYFNITAPSGAVIRIKGSTKLEGGVRLK